MDVNDGVISLVIPGWFWLLLIALAMSIIAAALAKKRGGVHKTIFEYETTEEWGWALLLTLMIGMPIAIIVGVVAHFVSS